MKFRNKIYPAFLFPFSIINLMISRSSLKIGHAGSKTKSLCKISLKHYSASRGHSFVLIFKDLYQNFWLDNVSVRLECGACRVKN